jgi:hypothetical protein
MLSTNIRLRILIFILTVLTFSSSIVAVDAATGFKVYLNLYHSKTGSAEACVYSSAENLGCKSIELADYRSPVEWGPWQFTPDSVNAGESFTVCVTNLNTGNEKCSSGINGPGKHPEYISFRVPDQTSSVSAKPFTPKYAGDWSAKCVLVQDYLINQCSTYVNPDGSLTTEGKRAYDCIAGGVLWSAGGFAGLSSLGIPATPGMIVDGLKIAAEFTNCGGIANFDKIKSSTDPLGILKNLGANIQK